MQFSKCVNELNKSTVIVLFQVPSKPPQSITAESHVTLTTIPVRWTEISSRHIHGVLLGYKVRYQVIAVGQEKIEDQPITEIRVNASTLSLVLGNLEVFTLYRIDVVGYTIMGDGPSAWINAGMFSIILSVFISTMVLINDQSFGSFESMFPSPGARFSKVPKTFRARKAICETANRLFWKADLLTCFQGNKKQNGFSPFLRYKGNCDTRKWPVKFRDFRETGSCSFNPLDTDLS